MLSVSQATFIQAKAQSFAWIHHLKQLFLTSRFLVYTVTLFLSVYLISAYILVSQGLKFVNRIPLIGGIFIERMLYLLFFFIFLMLILSNATITGISLFRRQETSWQLSLPLPHQSLVLWRTLEGLLLSSWGLLLLSAPILVAFGQVLHAGPLFYLLSLPGIVCLITIASNLSTWLLLFVVRFYRPWWLKLVSIGIVGVIVSILWKLRMDREMKFSGADVATNINQILRQTEICAHPLLPSSWLTDALYKSQDGTWMTALMYSGLLLSWALIVWYITSGLAKKLFLPSWNAAQYRREIHSVKQNQQEVMVRKSEKSWMSHLGIPRHIQALVRKDAIAFIREPMQWGQCALIFGLLLLYSTNIKNLGYDFNNPVWSTVISYLNLIVCALALSTLTTRFVFPQFSLEGQRLWIVGLAPFSLSKMLHQKLILNVVAMLPLSAFLVFIASYSLQLPTHRILFFLFAITLLTVGLNALALAMGTLLPNLKEQNAAKIVSSFGGTLCLILSFFYITLSVGLLVIPAYMERKYSKTIRVEEIVRLEWLCSLGLFTVMTLVTLVPYLFAVKKAKKLANLAVSEY